MSIITKRSVDISAGTIAVACAAITLSGAASPSLATENPVSAPNGADGFFAGALPPAGTYNLAYANYYRATRFNDSNGKSELPGFSETAKVFADKVVHMTDAHIFGGQVGFYGVAALADVNVQIAPGLADSRTGLLDPEGGLLVGWHTPEFHWFGIATVVVPFATYDKNRIVNLTSNYTTFRPQFGFSYLPQSGLDLSTRVTYNFNTTNRATGYKSGQWFHTEFNVGYPIAAGLKVGLQGYYLHQTTDDKQFGAKVGDGNRANVLAFGPALFYQISPGSSLEFRYEAESNAKNRAQGNSMWIKSVIAF